MDTEKQKWDTPLSAETFDSLVRFLHEIPENRTDPIIGIQLEFMERNGFDFGNNLFGYGYWIDSSINDFFVPEYVDHYEGPPKDERVPAQIVREIALQLRDYYRAKFDLPPLSDNEKAGWNLHLKLADRPWERVTQKRYRSNPDGVVALEFKALTDKQVKVVAKYMNKNYPEVARYQKAILQLAPVQGYNTEDEWISRISIWDCMNDCVEACFGSKMTHNQAIAFFDRERIAQLL